MEPLLLCQDKATTGKQGLGIKDRPKKVAGCYFEGKKTSFGNSDDEDSGDIDSQENETEDEVEKIVEPKLKLKKFCKQILKQASPNSCAAIFCPYNEFMIDFSLYVQVPGKSLKLKQLKVLVDQHSSSVLSEYSSKKEAIAYLKQKVCLSFTYDNRY